MKRKWLLIFAAAPLLLISAAMAVLARIGSERAIHPRPTVTEYELGEFGLPVEPVQFPSGDGTRLAGWFLPGRVRAAVVLAHGYASHRQEMLPHAAFLYEAGYSVLLFDFRHSGESGGDAVTVGARERYDLLGAVRYLRSGSEASSVPIAVLGVSMGAAAAILASAESHEIAAIVAECAYTSIESVIAQSFRKFIGLPRFPMAPLTLSLAERRVGFRARDVRPIDAITRLGSLPVLLIHGLADTMIDPSNSRALHAADAASNLWLVEGAAHARAYQAGPEEYSRRVLDFLQQKLLSEPNETAGHQRP